MASAPSTETAREVTGDEPALAGAIGAALGRYTIIGRVGAGGMGVVYRARDPALARDLAIKVVSARGGGEGQVRLLREAQAMARVRRPGVLPVFDVGILGGDGVYLVMPYLASGTLGDWLRASRRLWREVLDRFTAAGRGLATAHAAGLVHRDFKPENVLIDDDGAPVIADFGLARAAHDVDDTPAARPDPLDALEVTRTGAAVGTPVYMAPEQLRGQHVDARGDVFSYCVSFYEGIYGLRPFAADTGDESLDSLVKAIVERRLRPPLADRRVPGWLRAAIVRGLAADPAARWPSMDALLAHLDRRRKRPRRIAIAIAAVAALAAATTIFVATRAHVSATRTYRRQRITNHADLSGAALAPDGHSLAFIASGDVIVTDVDHPDRERVVAHDALGGFVPGAFGWSPDGARLYYFREPDRPATLQVVDVATGKHVAVPNAGAATFVGPHLLATWTITSKRLRLFDVSQPAASQRSCVIGGDYAQLASLVQLSDGTMIVGTIRDWSTSAIDRLVEVDSTCTFQRTIARNLTIVTLAATADRDRVVAGLDVPTTRFVAIDRDGEIAPLDVPTTGSEVPLGIRDDGSVLTVDATASWRLLHLGPGRPTTELAHGGGWSRIAMSPSRRRFAHLEPKNDHGGPVRVVSLDRADDHSPPIEEDVVAAGWVSDDELAMIVRGSHDALIVDDPEGHRISERSLASGANAPDVIALGDHEIAYQRDDRRTYVAIDLGTGAARMLLDPSRGYPFFLARAPHDGRLAFSWSTPDAAIYLVDGGPPRILAAGISEVIAWTNDGRGLLLVRGTTIDRYDLATSLRTPYVSVPGTGQIAQIWPATDDSDGSLYVHSVDGDVDVFAELPVP